MKDKHMNSLLKSMEILLACILGPNVSLSAIGLKKALGVMDFSQSPGRSVQWWRRNGKLFIEKKSKLLHLHWNVSQLYPLQNMFPLGIGWFENTAIRVQNCSFKQRVALIVALHFCRDDAFHLVPSYWKHLAQHWSPGCHFPLKHCCFWTEYLSNIP